MVKQSQKLDDIFGALADPTRRGILEQLSAGVSKVSSLAAPYEMSPPAISKHLRVLERAGLISRSRQGREHHIRVDPRPIEEAQGWMASYAQFWQQQFDAVDAYLKKNKPPQAPKGDL
ncbi:MAG: DNA-binding transcriptional ArsR family regulator [Pseudohongiellaceae bacterium]|jgi:DNA-binding transcriptional ArsR family regulator